MNQQHSAAAKSAFFPAVLTESGWQENVVIGFSADGGIDSIEPNQTGDGADEAFDAVALPGMANVHSHAFQRAFAGLSEFRTADRDSFWTWRKLMYDFLQHLTPDDVFIIARQLYLEMLLAGYTWVGEFHYVHHDVAGRRYANIGEISEAIIRAAHETGIGLSLMPVLYQRGGFDGSKLQGGQQRFELSNGEFLQLYEALAGKTTRNFVVNIALHSLRAVSVKAAKEVISAVLEHNPDCRIHIHVAEQEKEVEECLSLHDRRPIDFLYRNFDVNRNWCLIHATHMNENEVELIAGSGAIIGLCPTTEANLGDGVFPAPDFLKAGGRMAIGSDSHCSVDLRDELRTLEYGQRLCRQERAVLGTNSQSVGRHLFQQAASGGAAAIGTPGGVIAVGARADLTLVDANHPTIGGASGDRLIDRLIFCNNDDPIIGSIVGGITCSMDQPEFQQLVFESQEEFVNLCRRLDGK